MPLSVTIKINGQPTPLSCKIIQLDRTIVKVVGEMKNVLIWLSADERLCQFIDIIVADIPQAYRSILSRDQFAKLEGLFVIELSHTEPDTQYKILQFSWTHSIDCNNVNLVSDLESNTSYVELEDKFWLLYFDGSKTQEGSGAGCVLIN